jgi:glycerol uptake facilitator-like aquaporin
MTSTSKSTAQTAFSELIGTCLLVVAVVGSGIMAESLTQDVGVQLLANAAATAGALFALITMFGQLSGAHFNPLVSTLEALRGVLSWSKLPSYLLAQLVGGCIGTALANAMFDRQAWEWATKVRSGPGILLGELLATAGLLLVIVLSNAARPSATPATVAAWIGGAYWFTSSTSLANPAVTIARSLTDSFTGIAPQSVPLFLLMQLFGLMLALLLLRLLGLLRQS